MVRMIASLKQWYACWYCLSVGGIDMRGGREGEVYLGSIGVSNNVDLFLLLNVPSLNIFYLAGSMSGRFFTYNIFNTVYPYLPVKR